MKITGALIYLGIGMLLHVLLVGTSLDWQSAATWAVLLVWPVVIAAALAAIGLVIFVVISVFLAVTGR